MLKFPEIEGLHNVVKMLNKYDYMRPTKPISYKGKIKLHGTNGGIAIYPDGRVVAQSREQELVNGVDNCGFAKWVEANKSRLVDSFQHPYTVVMVFGEWCGQGIQKGCAIHGVTEKQFVIFVVQYGDNENATFVTEPNTINLLTTDIKDIVKVLPWYEPATIELDFNNVEQLRIQADKISALVLEVEKCDPWVKENFGVEGIGEGIVYYPVSIECNETSRETFTRFLFKAKGEKHQVKVQKQAAIVDPEIVKGVADFVNMFVTDNRCEQGVSVACGGQLDRKLTGQFLKWLCSDVAKESKAELEASGLTWDQVSKTVQVTAQKWWLARTGKI
jgi:hypothetical protein